MLKGLREETDRTHGFETYIAPRYYDAFVVTVQRLASESPQLALTLGHYIKQLCQLHIAESLKKGDAASELAGEQFMKLYNASWSTTVAAATSKKQRLEKFNTDASLPLTQDLVKLTSYIKDSIKKEVDIGESSDNVKLAKFTLAYLIIFNKRRPMEVEDLKVTDFTFSNSQQEERKEIVQHLSCEEKLIHER